MNIFSNPDYNEILMVSIFIFLCASIALIIILSLFKEKQKVEKVIEPKEEILEFRDLEDDNVATEKIDLDFVLEKMQEDLGKKEKDTIRSFEEEQEEKSIISYQELLKKTKKEDIIEPLDFKEEPEIIEIKDEECHEKKFKNSDFISPIYGKFNSEIDYPRIHAFEDLDVRNNEKITKELTKEKIDTEIEKNEKFLQQLKDFRKNLD